MNNQMTPIQYKQMITNSFFLVATMLYHEKGRQGETALQYADRVQGWKQMLNKYLIADDLGWTVDLEGLKKSADWKTVQEAYVYAKDRKLQPIDPSYLIEWLRK